MCERLLVDMLCKPLRFSYFFSPLPEEELKYLSCVSTGHRHEPRIIQLALLIGQRYNTYLYVSLSICGN